MKVSPAGAGLDERQLERVSEHLQHRYIDAGRIAGCQLAVARHGQVGYFRSLGCRDLGRSLPVEHLLPGHGQPIHGTGVLDAAR